MDLTRRVEKLVTTSVFRPASFVSENDMSTAALQLADVVRRDNARVIEGLKRHDPQLLDELILQYQHRLLRYLLHLTGNRAVAEDLFQETFIQVHRNARSFDPTRSFRPWLFTIAANKARDYLRAAGRRGTQSLDNSTGRDETTTFLDLLESDSPPPLAELTQAEGIAKVQQVLAELPAVYREVLILSYFHRFAYKQMAEMLNVPLGTVKSRLHGALAYFARAYRRQYGDPDLS